MAYGNIRTAQLVSVLTVIAAVAVIIVRRSTGRAKVKYLDAGEVPEAT